MSERRGTKGLELWCKKMTEGYPGVKVENMTSSWRDGLAFCAIIHHFRPDLIDFSKLNKDDVYHNNELAFRVAEHHLGIPALLEPEDMVEYDVPDRLSILTYLSQFYQAFAATQGASNRIPTKRPQSSPEHDIGSPTSSSPPTKVASIGVGKIRRDPCAKCCLPVFLAERLNIGKLLFHRTCFRCARCNSQLTLASYYETENEEYCCEICPDEEKAMIKTSSEKVVLQKSMSDEEKTASLRMITRQPDDYSEMFESALENVTSTEKTPNEFSEARNNFFLSQIGSDFPEQEEKPPLLPKTDPPELDKIDRPPKDIIVESARSTSGFPNTRLSEVYSNKVSVEKSIDSKLESLSHDIVTKDKPAEDGGNISLVKSRARLFESNTDDISKSDVYRNSKVINKVPRTPIKSTIPIVKLAELENFDNFSKKTNVNETDDKKFITILPEDTIVEDNVSNKDIDKNAQSEDIKDTSNSKIITGKEPNIIQNSMIERQPDIVVSHKIRNFAEKEESPAHDSGVETSEIRDVGDISSLGIQQTESPNQEVIDLTNISSAGSSQNLSPEEAKSFVDDETPVIEISDSSEFKSSKGSLEKTIEEDSSASVIVIEDSPEKTSGKLNKSQGQEYPDDLNPFDDEDVSEIQNKSSNPFGSDEEDEEVPSTRTKPAATPRMKKKILPAISDREFQGTPIRIERESVNPFESDEEEGNDDGMPPVPAARKKKHIPAPKISLNPFWSEDEESELKDEVQLRQPVPTPRTSIGSTPESKQRREFSSLNWHARHTFGSNSSISSGSAPGSARKKKPAPRPPIPNFRDDFGPSSLNFSPSHNVSHSPKLTPKHRKTRMAPPPPSMKTSTPIGNNKIKVSTESLSSLNTDSGSKSLEKIDSSHITLEADAETDKIVKDETNRNRQSQDSYLQSPTSSESSSNIPAPNKSTYGQWKRRKGQAPKRPIPQRRLIKVLPMSEIRRELDLIETQQQGLEKQGVKIEQIIREKCEGKHDGKGDSPEDDTPIEVEDLILQLFEIVNEKNDLFRKQTELMYLKRQHRLEEEHADVEYQIRCLIDKPEENKTDSDKAREEELIKRLVDIVERRNEIIECLENDRKRESEEDNCINNHITLYTLKRDSGEKSDLLDKSSKEKKKDKKDKDKHHKKDKTKHKDKKRADSDKDVDESETSLTKEKKKKKKFTIF